MTEIRYGYRQEAAIVKTDDLQCQQSHEMTCASVANDLALSDMRNREDSSLTEVLDLRFRDWPLSAVADSLVSDARNGIRQLVYFVNAHCVNVAARNESYRALLHSAPYLYADGAGMAIAARIFGVSLENNVNGTDLFPVLCKSAAKNDVPIALMGSSPGIAEACANNMKSMCPGLRVVWIGHGYSSDEEEMNYIDDINRSGARILLVAKGVPMQELWIESNASKITVPVIMGVGALFDFYSGAMPRSPLIFRKLRMEWFFRFLMEPRRLFRRYIIGNPEFLLRTIKMRLSRIL